jgi:hypothetical protein
MKKAVEDVACNQDAKLRRFLEEVRCRKEGLR